MKPSAIILVFLLVFLATGCQTPSHPTPKAGAPVLQVIFSNPTGEDMDPSGNVQIMACFSEPMVSLKQASAPESEGPFRFEPPLQGTYKWIGTRTLAFTPTKLPYSTDIKVTVQKNIVSENGSTLPADFTWTFATARPSIAASVPAASTQNVDPAQKVFLQFNQPIDRDKALPFVRFTATGSNGSEIVPFEVVSTTPEEIKKAFDLTLDRDVHPERIMVLKPAVLLKQGTQYDVALVRGMPGAEGSLGLAGEAHVGFSTYSPMRYNGLESPHITTEDPVVFRFSTPVTPADLMKHLKITPDLASKNESWGDDSASADVHIRYPWSPHREYHYTIDGDLKDVFGQKLDGPVTGAFSTEHYRSFVDVPEGTWSMESQLSHVFTLGFMNTPQVQYGIRRLEPSEALRLSRTMDDGDQKNKPLIPLQPLLSKAPQDVLTWRSIDLQPALGDRRHGLVLVEVLQSFKSPDKTKLITDQRALVQITDLGISMKTAPDATLVWVTRLSDGRPVAHAGVDLLDAKGAVKWHGETDAQGLCSGPGWQALAPPDKERQWEAPTLYASATLGEDTAFLASANVQMYGFDVSSDPTADPRQRDAFLFTERGIYRPGDSVHIKGIVREKQHGQWSVPSPSKAQLKIKNARGEEAQTVSLTTSEWGSFDYELKLDSEVPTGIWTMQVDAGHQAYPTEETFQVEAYRAVTFQVKAKSKAPRYLYGDTLQSQIDATYLYGAPVQQGPVSWRLYMAPYSGEFKGYDGYQFGPDPWLDMMVRGGRWWGEPEREASDVPISQGTGQLNGDGQLAIETPLRPSTVTDNRDVTLEATVTAPDNSKVTGRTTFPLFRGEFTLGTHLKSGFMEAQKGQSVQIVALDADGKPVAGKPVSVRWIRREWNSVRRYVGDWQAEVKDTPISTEKVTSGDKPVDVSFAPPQAGLYIVEASAQDSKGNSLVSTTSFWVWGSGYVGWSREGGDVVHMVADKSRYNSGDTAHIIVQSPYEKATALVTLERESVMERRVQPIVGSAAVIDIPLKEEHVPNVYVSVMLVEGRTGSGKYDSNGMDLARPSFKLGYINLPVAPAHRRLTVAIHPDRKSYGPRSTVTVDLNLTDAENHPVQGEITFTAADLAVLNLINFQTPNAFDRFYQQRPLAVQNSESRRFVLGQHRKGEKGAGGGADADFSLLQNLRDNFKTTACFTNVITDAQGHAQVTFALPDNLSTFRLMAVAHTKTSLFGSAETEIVVRKPLMMVASMPRFARPGDRFQAGVTVTNGTPERAVARVKVLVQGIAVDGSPEQSVDLPAQGSTTAVFQFSVPAGEGLPPAQVAFDAHMGENQDALKMDLPLLHRQTLQASAAVGETVGTADESVEVPAGARPGSARLETRLSSTALDSVGPAVEGLVQYPYGCMEQKTSKVFPMIEAGQLSSRFSLPGFDQETAKKYVADYMLAVTHHQKPSGGISLWGEEGEPESPFVSAYVALALKLAQDAGYVVPKPTLDRLLHYVKTLPTFESGGWNYPYDESDRLDTQCLAVFALSRWDVHDEASLNFLYDRRYNLDLFGQALLARSMVGQAKFDGPRHTLLTGFMQHLKMDPSTAYYEDPDSSQGYWTYQSRVRTNAAIVAAQLESGETLNASKVLTWLLRESKGGCWRTTQENAWMLETCLVYLKVRESVVPQMEADVLLDGHEIVKQLFSGRSTKVAQAITDLADRQPGAKLPVKVEAKGQGRLYYTLRLKYAPLDPYAWAQDQGLSVARDIAPVDSSEPAGSFQAGHVYRVTLSIVTPHERRFVVVDDPLAGGFEVVHTDFDTESTEMAQALNKAQKEDEKAAQHRWWDGTFDHFETYDDRVLLFANSLETGFHRYSYLVRATHAGTYTMDGAHAEEMYTPEVFGGTAPQEVTVK